VSCDYLALRVASGSGGIRVGGLVGGRYANEGRDAISMRLVSAPNDAIVRCISLQQCSRLIQYKRRQSSLLATWFNQTIISLHQRRAAARHSLRALIRSRQSFMLASFFYATLLNQSHWSLCELVMHRKRIVEISFSSKIFKVTSYFFGSSFTCWYKFHSNSLKTFLVSKIYFPVKINLGLINYLKGSEFLTKHIEHFSKVMQSGTQRLI